MALATIHSRAQNGLAAEPVTVEVHLSPGLPGLSIVGLPEAAVREAKDRVRAAIINCGYSYPARRITVNLAPADLPKEGGRFDLAIALGILAAAGEIPAEALADIEVLGELSLSGSVRAVRGALPAALQARENQRRLLLPRENLAEASLARGTRLHSAHHLGATCAALLNGGLADECADIEQAESCLITQTADLADVRGQTQAKRALEIAAAGGHSILMCGPPGSGKSMLAARLPGLLPPMTEDEAIESAAAASISNQGLDLARWGQRPYRAPHHTASGAALVGGGGQPRPGEITLAHHGVLFLDELPEFDRRVLEVLREPLESGHITISRAAQQLDFPARFQLVAAMNPCPCGYLGDPQRSCRCTPDQVARYRARISGPLLDRIDLQIVVPRPRAEELTNSAADAETSAQVQARVCSARQRQLARAGCANAQLDVPGIERDAAPDAAGAELLARVMRQLQLSARAYHRILKLARTIADLADEPQVLAAHVAEAVRLREFDRPA